MAGAAFVEPSRGGAMKFPRRKFLQLAGATSLAPTFSWIARAQTYPAKPVRYVVSAPAGGAQDLLARLIAQWLSQRLSQKFIIENRAGGGTNLATEMVVRAPADGYTLVSVAPTSAINATLYDKLNFNFIRDIAPVAGIIRSPLIMEVNPSFPAKTVPEFIAYAKSNPGAINFASAGIGTPGHVTGELFKTITGVKMQHVPYRGEAPALIDLLGGQVQLYLGSGLASIEYIRAGKLRALAVTTATRWEVLPDVPSLREFVPDFEASFWGGVGAPKNTPANIVGKLNKEINVALVNPTIKKHLADLGGTPLPGSPADFGKLIADETEKWGKVIRAANIKVE
jgi:tripartite-type tricarboxylate transporter receptor subunit TctC